MAASGADAWQTVILNVGIGQKFHITARGLVCLPGTRVNITQKKERKNTLVSPQAK